MDGTNGLKETTLSVNVFTAPGKTMVGERPKPFGEPLGFDPITSTLIFGEYDAVLVDAMGTVAEAEALADWIALHNRNLETIYITHAHFDHFYGLSILLDLFPRARAIATPKTVNAMQMSFSPTVERLAAGSFRGKCYSTLAAKDAQESPLLLLPRARMCFVSDPSACNASAGHPGKIAHRKVHRKRPAACVLRFRRR